MLPTPSLKTIVVCVGVHKEFFLSLGKRKRHRVSHIFKALGCGRGYKSVKKKTKFPSLLVNLRGQGDSIILESQRETNFTACLILVNFVKCTIVQFLITNS